MANGKILVAHAVGTVKLKLQQPDGSITEVLLHNVVFHPEFSHNLLSVRRLWRDNRIKTRFGERNYFKESSPPSTTVSDHKKWFQFHTSGPSGMAEVTGTEAVIQGVTAPRQN